ncbi:hypothetical protein CPC08DRAFT_630305 [Agrocybe pediades]|nr:hypothetical protein CPC08DRAFT_630305 [Agrocybe pediades]
MHRFGDWYRPCAHFVVAYYSGERIDCNSSNCALSSAHEHTAEKCPCPKVARDRRRIVNMFHKKCDDCTGANDFIYRRGREGS